MKVRQAKKIVRKAFVISCKWKRTTLLNALKKLNSATIARLCGLGLIEVFRKLDRLSDRNKRKWLYRTGMKEALGLFQ
jgi:hypothetical protein